MVQRGKLQAMMAINFIWVQYNGKDGQCNIEDVLVHIYQLILALTGVSSIFSLSKKYNSN